MNNHFGKGLMAGLKATHADSAVNVTKFCADYKRGFVLGYFRENNSCSTLRFFMAGYRLEN